MNAKEPAGGGVAPVKLTKRAPLDRITYAAGHIHAQLHTIDGAVDELLRERNAQPDEGAREALERVLKAMPRCRHGVCKAVAKFAPQHCATHSGLTADRAIWADALEAVESALQRAGGAKATT